MTQINVNNFVQAGSVDHLLEDGDGYEVTIKKLENKNVSKFHCGHTQFMEIVTKYNLKPKWTIWENKFDEEGKVVPNKGKYVIAK